MTYAPGYRETTTEQRNEWLSRLGIISTHGKFEMLCRDLDRAESELAEATARAEQLRRERDALAELLSTEKGCIYNDGCKYRGDNSWMCPDCYREYAKGGTTMSDHLSEIKARRAGTAKGWWRVASLRSQNAFCIHVMERKEFLSDAESSNTVDFLAAAPADIDWLIAEVERLQTELAAFKDEEIKRLRAAISELSSVKTLLETPINPNPE